MALELRDRAERDAAAAHVLVNPELDAARRGHRARLRGLPVDPGLRGLVPRHAAGRLPRPRPRTARAVGGRRDGLFARVLQHEVDHLDGILYPMRMTDLRELAFTSELPHLTAWLERVETRA